LLKLTHASRLVTADISKTR